MRIYSRIFVWATRTTFGLACWLVSGRLTGWRDRIERNIDLVVPELSPKDRATLCRTVPFNMGRTFGELVSGKHFVELVRDEPLQGPGAQSFERCHVEGKPALLITGHIGNYDAIRGALVARGYRVGGLYRPMSHAWFNRVYIRSISQVGALLFPKGKKGLKDMLLHLKSGGIIGVVNDQHSQRGIELPFLGRPALTSLSFAECQCWTYSPQKCCLNFPQFGAGFDLQGGMPP